MRRALVFGAWLLVLEMLAFVLSLVGWLEWLKNGTAAVAGVLIRLTGVPATVLDYEIMLDVRTLVVSTECTGVFLAALLIALFAAAPGSIRSRFWGALAGVGVLFVANVMRLLAVAHIRDWQAFDFVHDIVFQVGFVALVLSVWLVWLEKTVPAPRGRHG